MALAFSVLGSGSSGNCTLLRLDGGGRRRHVLIDAGLAPKVTARRLAPLGVGLDDVTDVLLTHPDTDHLHAGWIDARDRTWRPTWRLHRRHLRRARASGLPARETAAFEGDFALDARTRIEAVLLPHDQLGTAGYVIEHGSSRLGFATDLGRVTSGLLERFTGLAAVAIESNYDRAMQAASPRPAMLKRRIMGGMGHLSNEQALEAVLELAAGSDLGHVVLLHVSRQCNDPRLIRRLFAGRAPHLLARLTIAHQHVPTPLLHLSPRAGRAQPGEQLVLFEGRPGPPRPILSRR